MTRLRFTVAYDGTDFCGWQRQNHGPQRSVQDHLEEALAKVFNEKITLFASGRTDAGVHAVNQVCHFETSRSEESMKGWDPAWALKAHLPDQIVPKKFWIAPQDFHSTLSAEKKTYRYYLRNHPRPSPFTDRFAAWKRHPVRMDYLNECSRYLLGHHDFKSFQSVGTPIATTDRTIYEAKWVLKSPNTMMFSITGEGFLKQMVRNIIGTQFLLERKGLPASDFKEILKACDRRRAGAPAPAEGLFLWRVYYPQDLDKRCRPL